MSKSYFTISDWVVETLERGGFSVVRSTDSHRYLVHKGDPSRRAVVPFDPGFLSFLEVQDILNAARGALPEGDAVAPEL